MNYSDLKKFILAVKLGEKKVVYKVDMNTEVFVNKPTKVPTRLNIFTLLIIQMTY